MNGRVLRHIGYAVLFAVILGWSAIQPKDQFTWFLETLPAMLAVLLFVAIYRRFRFTELAYVLVLVHCAILSCLSGRRTGV